MIKDIRSEDTANKLLDEGKEKAAQYQQWAKPARNAARFKKEKSFVCKLVTFIFNLNRG